MVSTVLNSLREKKAKFARDVEYIKEMALDDEIDDALDRVESAYIRESAEDIEEARELLTEMVDDSEQQDAAEINRILEATHDLSFDEMIGIETNQ